MFSILWRVCAFHTLLPFLWLPLYAVTTYLAPSQPWKWSRGYMKGYITLGITSFACICSVTIGCRLCIYLCLLNGKHWTRDVCIVLRNLLENPTFNIVNTSLRYEKLTYSFTVANVYLLRVYTKETWFALDSTQDLFASKAQNFYMPR